MGTILVAGRVEESSKAAADAVIRRAGLTSSDVIRVVWDNIATTGRIPEPERGAADADEVLARLDRLRAATPRSPRLESMTPQGVKDELATRR